MEEVCEGKEFSFPTQEEKILSFWSEIKAFETQLERTKDLPEYIFYDGPPFATGLPHYGHILAGTIKDIVTRYQTMTGHHVTRRFGWDCHGLPVEAEIDKKLGIKRRDEVLKLGIDKYNEECRGIVTRYVGEWEKVVVRVGRWIDFKNDYKTMDLKFMESVWWVFSKLFEKGLVYKGFKVMPYSTGCKTVLSNFEVQQNYKDVPDPEIMVTFPIVDDPHNAAFVAWTTTPWTLPSNLALCVNGNFDYIKVVIFDFLMWIIRKKGEDKHFKYAARHTIEHCLRLQIHSFYFCNTRSWVRYVILGGSFLFPILISMLNHFSHIPLCSLASS